MLDKLDENMKMLTGKKKPLKRSLSLYDTGFFSEENLQEAKRRGIEVLIPDPQFRQRDEDFEERGEVKKEKKERYMEEDFTYNKKDDSYRCPAGKVLSSKGKIKLRNNEGKKYHASAKDCGQCPLIGRCIKMKKESLKRRSKRVWTLYIVEGKYGENLSEAMKEKIDNPAYRELYTRRQQIIEPVFSDITYCIEPLVRGMNRFTLRGDEKVDTQWQLYCIAHNIGKCISPVTEKYVKKHKRKGKTGQACG